MVKILHDLTFITFLHNNELYLNLNTQIDFFFQSEFHSAQEVVLYSNLHKEAVGMGQHAAMRGSVASALL